LEQLAEEVSTEQEDWTAPINLLNPLIAAHPGKAELVRMREDADERQKNPGT
jgi:hypothetical protein